jgi:hypothetical protein
LTQDYETRTTLSIYKVSFTWITSNVSGFLMFAIWLKDTGRAGDGLLSQHGYQAGAHWFAAALLLSSVIVPLGLRSYIPLLREHALEAHPPAQTALHNLLSTYSNRSMLALLAAAVFWPPRADLRMRSGSTCIRSIGRALAQKSTSSRSFTCSQRLPHSCCCRAFHGTGTSVA